MAVLSALWAAIEIYLGLFLKSIQIHFSGSILMFLELIIIFLSRTLVPKRGIAVLMGVTIAFLKFFYMGGMAVYSISAIGF